MFNSKSSKPQSRIDSLIGATTRIEGNIVFSGGLRVDGMVRGNVAALPDQPGTLVVSTRTSPPSPEPTVSHLGLPDACCSSVPVSCAPPTITCAT